MFLSLLDIGKHLRSVHFPVFGKRHGTKENQYLFDTSSQTATERKFLVKLRSAPGLQSPIRHSSF